MQRKGFSEDTIEILISSLAETTMKQYNTALKYWWEYCIQNSQNPFSADDKTILECLTKKFKENAAYGSLNTMRSAIALINEQDNSQNNNINRFFKGAFRLRPAAPRYDTIWDTDPVLKLLQSYHPLDSLDLMKLTEKLTMLLALGSAYRVQSLSLIKLDGISFSDRGVEIKISDLIKTSRPGTNQPSCFLPYLKENLSLCIPIVLKEYISRTEPFRDNENQLMISFKKPYKAVGSQTISRWLKKVMRDAGVDENYKGHSTRHAATSKAFKSGLNINDIKKAAGWSKNSNTFFKFYNRPIINNKSLAEAVLT